MAVVAHVNHCDGEGSWSGIRTNYYIYIKFLKKYEKKGLPEVQTMLDVVWDSFRVTRTWQCDSGGHGSLASLFVVACVGHAVVTR